jgi:hypothetical protein
MRIDALSRLKSEMLDIERDVERESLAAGPRIVLALCDRQEIVSFVVRQLEHALLPSTRRRFLRTAR